MNEENEQIQEVDEPLELLEVAEGEKDTTDWKELALKQQGINKRLKTKNEKAKEEIEELKKPPKKPEPETPEPKEKPSDFDYGQKAFLKSYGIDGADERELVKTWVDRTGDDLDKAVEDDILKAKLEKLREAKSVDKAIPSSAKRSPSEAPSAVDYWLEKPFKEVPKDMRRKVLEARIQKEETKAKFG